jgi:hypothetical protein
MSEVAPGQHELVVRKPGFVDYRAMFKLGKGETKTLPAVELVPNVKEVGFSIRSAPPGAEVWVDGHATDQLTPAKLTGVNPGIHRLQLKRAGYADYELQFFVPDNTLLQLPTAELVSAESASTAAPPPPPAHEARESKRPSDSDDADDQSAADKRRERLERRAAKRAAAASSSSSSSRSSSSSSPRASRANGLASSPAPQMAPPPMQQSAPAGNGKMGTLRINSRPWAQVIVDGRPVGNTPQPNLMLPAGNHKVVLSNPQMGLTKSFSVTIKTGQMVTKVMNLAE